MLSDLSQRHRFTSKKSIVIITLQRMGNLTSAPSIVPSSCSDEDAEYCPGNGACRESHQDCLDRCGKHLAAAGLPQPIERQWLDVHGPRDDDDVEEELRFRLLQWNVLSQGEERDLGSSICDWYKPKTPLSQLLARSRTTLCGVPRALSNGAPDDTECWRRS